jgi:hypothetical protein
MSDESMDGAPPEVRCAECSTLLPEGTDIETTDGGTFCRYCFNALTTQVQRSVSAQGENINYLMAAVGGLIGGVLGSLLWWGFTVVTNIAFGLVAIAIGFAVGKGVVLLSGHKRSQQLQIMSAVISAIFFFYASYLVNRTFILRLYADDHLDLMIPVLPTDPALFMEIVQANFSLLDFVFLAIVVYQAWKMPAPFRLQ